MIEILTWVDQLDYLIYDDGSAVASTTTSPTTSPTTTPDNPSSTYADFRDLDGIKFNKRSFQT